MVAITSGTPTTIGDYGPDAGNEVGVGGSEMVCSSSSVDPSKESASRPGIEVLEVRIPLQVCDPGGLASSGMVGDSRAYV